MKVFAKSLVEEELYPSVGLGMVSDRPAVEDQVSGMNAVQHTWLELCDMKF
jgi:hypothetical protein